MLTWAVAGVYESLAKTGSSKVVEDFIGMDADGSYRDVFMRVFRNLTASCLTQYPDNP